MSVHTAILEKTTDRATGVALHAPLVDAFTPATGTA
jgi:hypothetical protein